MGGGFSLINGVSRLQLGQVTFGSNSPTSWVVTPSLVTNVYALAVLNGTLYVGGNFISGTFNGEARSNLVALDATTGAPKAWNPGANAIVYSLAAINGYVLAGALFTTIGGLARNNLAAIDPLSGCVY